MWFCVPNMWHCHVDTISHLLITQLRRQPLQTRTSFLFWFNAPGTAKCSVFRTGVNRSDTNCLRCFYSIHYGRRYTRPLCTESMNYILDSHEAAHNLLPAFGVSDCSVTPCRMTDKSKHFQGNYCRPPSACKPREVAVGAGTKPYAVTSLRT